jgi:hypothetical protein
LELQSFIAKARNNDKFVLVASLDLSSAFDLVNVNLLLKQLKTVGQPDDIISLISVELKDKSYYVSIEDQNSFFLTY